MVLHINKCIPLQSHLPELERQRISHSHRHEEELSHCSEFIPLEPLLQLDELLSDVSDVDSECNLPQVNKDVKVAKEGTCHLVQIELAMQVEMQQGRNHGPKDHKGPNKLKHTHGHCEQDRR